MANEFNAKVKELIEEERDSSTPMESIVQLISKAGRKTPTHHLH